MFRLSRTAFLGGANLQRADDLVFNAADDELSHNEPPIRHELPQTIAMISHPADGEVRRHSLMGGLMPKSLQVSYESRKSASGSARIA